MGAEFESFLGYDQNVEEPKVGYMVFTKDLETGIAVMDEQHRHYIDLLNEYCEKASRHTDTNEQNLQLIQSLEFLVSYAEEHFATEELIMRDSHFPDHTSHLEEHLDFMQHVRKLQRELAENGFSDKLSREVNYYTAEWFVDHILGADMQLVEYLKAKDIKM